MGKKEEENEKREFQIAMLKVQLKFESEISYLTTGIAFVISFLVAIFVLSFSNMSFGIPLEAETYLEWNFHLMEAFLLIILAFLSVAYSWTRYRWMPKELENLRKSFIKPKESTNSKEEKPSS